MWIIDIVNFTSAAIDISFNEPFGIQGKYPSCPNDYLEVLDGVGGNLRSLGKFCDLSLPAVVETSFNRATVIFQASTVPHGLRRVGASMSYEIVLIDGKLSLQEVRHVQCVHVCTSIQVPGYNVSHMWEQD